MAARTALASNAPSTYAGLVRDDDALHVEPVGSNLWEGKARYSKSDFQPPQTGEASFSFDTTGGTQVQVKTIHSHPEFGNEWGMDIALLALATFGVGYLARPLGAFVLGHVGDRFGRKRVIWISILGVLPFTLLLPYASLGWTRVLTVVIGLILASAFSAILVHQAAGHPATAAGYRDHGAPGERPVYHPGYYGAFVLDPDGNNVEAVCTRA